jgi:hypothetical protein
MKDFKAELRAPAFLLHVRTLCVDLYIFRTPIIIVFLNFFTELFTEAQIMRQVLQI